MRIQQKAAAIGMVALFVLVALPAPAQANPAVPYCHVASAAGGVSAINDQYLVDACVATTGRVFPEAMFHEDYVQGPRGFTGVAPYVPATDYVGYFEFQQALEYLSTNYPDWIEVHEVALSTGNTNALGGPERVPIYMLEISNEQSPIPRDEKLNLLFMLSIHGNEKGGREGGFRVLEDLLRDIGFATETVQNGAGLPEPIAKPTGGNVETYRDYLDFMNVFLLFPNADGWVCDELEYGLPVGAVAPGVLPAGDGCQGNFRRGNGNNVDLNRQTPTIGWHNPNRNVMGEAESGAPNDPDYPGFGNWLVDQRENSNGTFQWNYAIDIHGMLTHKNFGAIMLPAGSFTPQEMHRSLRLADTLKDRWNADSHFGAWRTLFQTVETGWAASDPAREGAATAMDSACIPSNPSPLSGCILPGSALSSDSAPTEAAGSSQFAEYYTVIDAIGYTDSGFNGDFFAQTTGLNAPGYDIELAYNHLVTGSQYEGPGAFFNDYHVWMVRHIVKSFLDAAALDVRISYETAGAKTAYVPTQYVATNLDDVDAEGNPAVTPGGWADQNPGDDQWDYGLEDPFFARPAKYWEDIKPFVCENCGTDQALPGVFEARLLDDLDASALDNFDNLVIAGSAINQFYTTGTVFENTLPYIEGDEGVRTPGAVNDAKVQQVLDWVEAGGNLVLTDAALKFFDLAGITTDAVDRTTGYMGGIRMDLSHPMLDKVNGGVKQTYEPTPIGFGTTGAAPNWAIDAEAFNNIGGSVAGLRCAGSSLGQNCEGNDIALGEYSLGAGRIQFMGAVLPDPTEEFYHPYGLDHYATTYSANQIVRNMLGWDEVFANPPITFNADGSISQTENEPTLDGANGPGGAGTEGSGKDSPGIGLMALLGAVAAALVVRRK